MDMEQPCIGHFGHGKQIHKPVVFYGPIAPPVLNAPSSDLQNDADATFLDLHICRRLPLHATISGMANFKMYLLHQFCSNRVEFFLQYTRDTDARNEGPEF